MAKDDDPFALIERAKELASNQIEAARRKVVDAQAELDKLLQQFGGMLGLTSSSKKPVRKFDGSRAPRGERSGAILSLLKDKPDGLSRGDIIQALGAKGNKAEEGSISNALTNLKKQNKLGSREGRYVLP